MSERSRILLFSIASLVLVSGAAVSLAMGLLYRAAFEQQRSDLLRMVKHRACIFQTVADFDAESGKAGLSVPDEGTEVSQIIEVYKSFAVFGDTGELTIARREGDRLVWLLRPRHVETGSPSSSSLDPQFGQAMWRALSGESGTMVGIDYRGRES